MKKKNVSEGGWADFSRMWLIWNKNKVSFCIIFFHCAMKRVFFEREVGVGVSRISLHHLLKKNTQETRNYVIGGTLMRPRWRLVFCLAFYLVFLISSTSFSFLWINFLKQMWFIFFFHLCSFKIDGYLDMKGDGILEIVFTQILVGKNEGNHWMGKL